MKRRSNRFDLLGKDGNFIGFIQFACPSAGPKRL